MRQNKNRNSVCRVLVGLLIIISCVGCVGMIGSAVISGFPTYEDTVAAWPPVEAGNGRVLFYYVKQPGSGLVGPSVLSLIIDGDRDLRASFSDRTFVFADLSAGKHVVEIDRGRFRKTLSRGIDIDANNTVYVRLDREKNESNDLIYGIVEQEVALSELKEMHHNFKKAKSIYYQPKPLF